MNSKKGGSLASNHVLRLLKGDCKKGGKRTRTKRSKSKSKKSKRRTKKPKVIKRKKRTRNKKTKKKIKVGGLLGYECKPININAGTALDDLYNNRKQNFTCPRILLVYFNNNEEIFKEAFIGNTDEAILEKDKQKRDKILDHMRVQAMIYLIGYNNTSVLGDFYTDASSDKYFKPHKFTTGDNDKFKSFINLFSKIFKLYDEYKKDYEKEVLKKFISKAIEQCKYYIGKCPDSRRASAFCKFTYFNMTTSSTIHKRFYDILSHIYDQKEFKSVE